MMERGELLAKDVLPKVAKEMKKVAAVGLEQKKLTTRVAQGTSFNDLTKSMNTIFKGGFDKSLAKVFRTLSKFMNENQKTLENIGKVFSVIFDFINGVAKVVVPIVMAIADAFGMLAIGAEKLGSESLGILISQLGLLLAALSPVYRMAMLIVAAFDEADALLRKDKVGLIEVLLGKDLGNLESKVKEAVAIAPPESLSGGVASNSSFFHRQKDSVIASSQQNQKVNIDVTMEEGLELRMEEFSQRELASSFLTGTG